MRVEVIRCFLYNFCPRYFWDMIDYNKVFAATNRL